MLGDGRAVKKVVLMVFWHKVVLLVDERAPLMEHVKEYR